MNRKKQGFDINYNMSADIPKINTLEPPKKAPPTNPDKNVNSLQTYRNDLFNTSSQTNKFSKAPDQEANKFKEYIDLNISKRPTAFNINSRPITSSKSSNNTSNPPNSPQSPSSKDQNVRKDSFDSASSTTYSGNSALLDAVLQHKVQSSTFSLKPDENEQPQKDSIIIDQSPPEEIPELSEPQTPQEPIKSSKKQSSDNQITMSGFETFEPIEEASVYDVIPELGPPLTDKERVFFGLQGATLAAKEVSSEQIDQYFSCIQNQLVDHLTPKISSNQELDNSQLAYNESFNHVQLSIDKLNNGVQNLDQSISQRITLQKNIHSMISTNESKAEELQNKMRSLRNDIANQINQSQNQNLPLLHLFAQVFIQIFVYLFWFYLVVKNGVKRILRKKYDTVSLESARTEIYSRINSNNQNHSDNAIHTK